jgi:hypothetical protein
MLTRVSVCIKRAFHISQHRILRSFVSTLVVFIKNSVGLAESGGSQAMGSTVIVVRLRVESHYTARHGTARQNILSWFSYARIHTSPSPIGDDKDSVVGTERREYFACLLTNFRFECTLVFVVSCRCRVVPYNVNRPLTVR